MVATRLGAHCQWDGGGNTLGFFYLLRPFDTELPTTQNNPNVEMGKGGIELFFETAPMDAVQNVGNELAEAVVLPEPVWWTVDLQGYEQYVRAEGPTELQAASFLSPQRAWKRRPAGGVRSTHLQARLTYNNNQGGTRYVDIDIGPGIRISILSYYVRVGLLLPPGAKEVVKGRPKPPILVFGEGETAAQALVTGSISASESPIGQRIASYTQTIRVPATDVASRVTIPAAAVQLQVYQGPEGDVDPLEWALFGIDGNPVLGPGIGQIDFIPTLRNTGWLEVNKRATHIGFPNADPDNARIYTLVFRLEL